MIIVIMVLQIVLPMMTVILESDFTIKSIAAEALEATVDGITWIYEVEDEKAVNVKPKDKYRLSEEVIIPSKLNGYTVTSIGKNAFYGCSSLTSYCNSESLAKTYAKESDINYVIDGEAPIITNVEGNPEEWTKRSVILTVSVNDSLSGLAKKAYSFDGGESWQEENTKEYTENTNGIVIKVRDSLGNETTYEEEINITKIAKVEKIEIKAEPTKKEYVEGEALDTAGMLIKATYNNGTPGEIIEELKEEITQGFICTPSQLNTVGTQTITIMYGEKTASFSVKVVKKADVNGDNKVDFMDMLKVNQYRLGKISSF